MSQASASTVQQITSSFAFEYPKFSYNNEHSSFFMASLKAPVFESEARSSRAPLDLVCVIDKSGSMAGSKLDLVKKTLSFVVEQLKSSDRLAIVAFDTDVSTPFSLMSMDDKGKERARAAINQVKAGTCTNLSGGLFQGFEIVKSRTKPADVVSVLILTDGQANKGVTSTTQIVSGIQSYYQKIGSACSLFTFGFGADHDANMLRPLSEAGNGMYYYIEKEDEIPEAFGNCLGGLISVVAQNIRLKVEALASGIRIKKFVSVYKRDEIEKERSYDISIGDLYSEESRDLIMEVELPPLQMPQDNAPVFNISLSYFNVATTSSESVSIVATVGRPEKPDPSITPNVSLDKQRNRELSANAMAEARSLADKNQLDAAKLIITNAISQIEKSVSGKDPFCVALVSDLTECLNTFSSKELYVREGTKMLHQMEHSNRKQRNAYNKKSAAQTAYSNAAQQQMQVNAQSYVQQQSAPAVAAPLTNFQYPAQQQLSGMMNNMNLRNMQQQQPSQLQQMQKSNTNPNKKLSE